MVLDCDQGDVIGISAKVCYGRTDEKVQLKVNQELQFKQQQQQQQQQVSADADATEAPGSSIAGPPHPFAHSTFLYGKYKALPTKNN